MLIKSKETMAPSKSAGQRMLKKIQIKWDKNTKDMGGFFIRHFDGNTHNNCINNLERVHPKDAFRHADWAIDWVIDLTDEEIEFVHANLNTLAELYS